MGKIISESKRDSEYITTTSSKVSNILKQIHNNFIIGSSQNNIKKGETSWYKYCSNTIQRLSEYIPLENLHKYLICHISH